MEEMEGVVKEMVREELNCVKEEYKWQVKSYQWIIVILIGAVGFLSGSTLQAERYKEQQTINTTEIRILKEKLATIDTKLDQIITASGRR